MFRVVPAVLVSKRNDEIAIARAPGLAQASRDLGFDPIYDLIVEWHVITGKIHISRDCLRDMRSKKKREQSEEPAKQEFSSQDLSQKAEGFARRKKKGHDWNSRLGHNRHYTLLG